MKKYQAILSAIIILLLAAGASTAMMGGGNGSGMSGGGNGSGMSGSGNGSGMSGSGNGSDMMNGNSSGMMNGNTSMMTNGGNFGMMNGVAGTPIVGANGTAYFVSTVRTTNPSTTPNSNSFMSTILAVNPSGKGSSLTLNGIVSRPFVEGNTLVATASLPDFSNYNMMGNNGTNGASPAPGQSILYAITLPWSESSKPLAISMDGGFASVPVIANNRIYVTTSDYGNAMMGNAAFNSMNGNYNLNNGSSAKTYLYIFNLDGSLVSKTSIE